MSYNLGDNLADTDGYDVYDEIQLALSETYYGVSGIEDTDSFIFRYMQEISGKETKEDVIKYYNEGNYDAEIQAAFEERVANGTEVITVDFDGETVSVTDISQYNREYDLSVAQIKKTRERSDFQGENTKDTSLNGVVVNINGSDVLLIEGSNGEEDVSDWKSNFDMIGNNHEDTSKETPEVYKEAWKYYDGLDTKPVQVVGNSQGGGSAIYVGMQSKDALEDPPVEVVAINPSPQRVEDVDMNGSYPNITIIYTTHDPLYNLSHSVGFETEIPDANILHVEFGLAKLDSNTMMHITAAHTGSISAVDYNRDGVLDDSEKEFGIILDDVIPRCVFTNKILGSNPYDGNPIAIDTEALNNFAIYLNTFHAVDMKGIIDRNEKARNTNNIIKECKVESTQAYCKVAINKFEELIKSLSIELDSSAFKLSLLNVFGNIAGFAANGNIYPITEEWLEALSRVVPIERSDKKINEFISFLENSLLETSNSIISMDYVGHNGDYAIADSLEQILSTLNEEEEKIILASENLEKCSIHIGDVFESTDQKISSNIQSTYMKSSIEPADEIFLHFAGTYKSSLSILATMSIVNQIERVVDNGVIQVVENLKYTLDSIFELAKDLVSKKSDVIILMNYDDVVRELKSDMDTEKNSPKNMNEYSYGKINEIIDVLKSIEIDDLPGKLTYLETALNDSTTLSNGLAEYLRPFTHSLFYDNNELGVVRDTLVLNKQVLQRMNTELGQAYLSLESSVEFMGKDSLTELVKELGLRVSALTGLHDDIFDRNVSSIPKVLNPGVLPGSVPVK